MGRMRCTAVLLFIVALGACEPAPAPLLFKADCQDGTTVVATRQQAESACARRRGIVKVEPLPPSDQTSPDG
jgi:hypothetical protein